MSARSTPEVRRDRPVGADPVRVRPRTRAVAAALAGAAVLVQMAFPFTDGGTLALTAASVLLLAAAAVTHAASVAGPLPAAVLLVVAGGVGLVAEAVGVRTGFPFGDYAYTGTLGLEVLGVPALVPLAWVMMTWPALLVARRLIGAAGRHRRLATALVGAWALTAWDVFLDPQMVDQGHWTWAHPTPGLPGVDGIPLTNFAGWLVVSLVLVAAMDRLLPRTASDLRVDGVAVGVYLWTFFSSVLAHAAFFGRPPVALVGAVAMGVVAVPLVRHVVREVREVRARRGVHRG
ncbi:carotenoid biosynthesis protein [Nocardioides alkalitolerans]|uniref:carotenoid biosynthesis protein n=1 Tax=Nocardioides alkalitolerans TaxID=281714 RepID=UPI0003FCF7B6|nr:carotenoid biosynthesis protein [Nocardioides alkalitolerans]